MVKKKSVKKNPGAKIIQLHPKSLSRSQEGEKICLLARKAKKKKSAHSITIFPPKNFIKKPLLS